MAALRSVTLPLWEIAPHTYFIGDRWAPEPAQMLGRREKSFVEFEVFTAVTMKNAVF
jgi:hypothetical protein